MKSSDLRLVIFDCDGTLVDSFGAIHDAMAAAFRDFGLAPPPAARLRPMIGLPVAQQVSTLLSSGKPDQWLALERAYREHRLGNPSPEEPLFPGARACLEALDRAEVLMAVATAKSAMGLTKTLELHALRQHFVSLQTGDTNPSKPSPGMVNAAIAATGVSHARTVLVGDTRFDIEMAVNAGVTPIGVSWGYHEEEELAGAGAVVVASDFAELTRILLERLPLA